MLTTALLLQRYEGLETGFNFYFCCGFTQGLVSVWFPETFQWFLFVAFLGSWEVSDGRGLRSAV